MKGLFGFNVSGRVYFFFFLMTRWSNSRGGSRVQIKPQYCEADLDNMRLIYSFSPRPRKQYHGKITSTCCLQWAPSAEKSFVFCPFGPILH